MQQIKIKGYFQYAGGFEPRKAYDISATLPDNGYRDPMFIVEAVKEKWGKIKKLLKRIEEGRGQVHTEITNDLKDAGDSKT